MLLHRLALNERLGIDIPESDYAKLSSLNALLDYIGRKAGRDV